jgi:proteasome assembly chaperone (PAC2) family protein
MAKENVIFVEKPRLRRPFLVCGIGGWVDGGEAATESTRYLARKLGAKLFAEMPLARFHIYQVPGQVSLRPEIRIEDGLLKEHVFPQNQFYYWIDPHSEHDLIIFLGTEPSLNWEEYAGAILDIARQYSVTRTYLPGGVLDKTPHSREAGVFCACTSAQLRREMEQYGMQSSNYEGPGSFGSTLLYLAQKRRMPLVSLIARATYYPEYNIVIPRNPKAIKAIVLRLSGLLRLGLDLSDLDREAGEFEAKLDFMASHNPEFRAYIEELEKEYTEVKFEEPLDISAREAVQLAEELLKEQREEE